MIYLDYAANTPVDKEVLDYFYEVSSKYYANPNSIHKLGLEAKKIIDDSTEIIANNLHVLPEEIIYTSGATESNNMVIKGICERYKNKGKHIIVSSLEHNSTIASATFMQDRGFDVDLVPVNSHGLVDIDELKEQDKLEKVIFIYNNLLNANDHKKTTYIYMGLTKQTIRLFLWSDFLINHACRFYYFFFENL